MKIFPVFHPPMLCCLLKFLIVTLFAFYFVTLALFLMSPGKLPFPISNCDVFVFVTLASVVMVSNCIPIVLYLEPCLSNNWKNIFPLP